MICTIYSHQTGFDTITEILRDVYPKGELKITRQDEFQIALLEIKGGLLGSPKKLKVSYRERKQPSYQIKETDTCPLVENLKGLYGFVQSLPASNEKVRDQFLEKILTLNCEFSIIQEEGETKELKHLIQTMAKEFDAILFAQPGTVISKANGQHFLDSELNLLLDRSGNTAVDHLNVVINSQYYDKDQSGASADQIDRKARSQQVLEQHHVNINYNLPYVESESETTIRSAREIAQRVSALAVTNHVAFNNLSGGEAIAYLKEYKLWDYVTSNERTFLDNPTEEQKSYETWKCEGIWTLMWALKKVDDLGFPDELCSLDNIDYDDYPVGPDKDPNDFINQATEVRSKKEILDACDLYYRMDWACVDARINNKQIEEVNPGVVYERHYALNWLVNYMGQEWDDVSCDT